MAEHTVVTLPGDGIGKIVLPEALRVQVGRRPLERMCLQLDLAEVGLFDRSLSEFNPIRRVGQECAYDLFDKSHVSVQRLQDRIDVNDESVRVRGFRPLAGSGGRSKGNASFATRGSVRPFSRKSMTGT